MSERLLTVRCTQAEYGLWQSVAGHRALSRWARDVLNTAAATKLQPEGVDHVPVTSSGGEITVCYHGLQHCAICDY